MYNVFYDCMCIKWYIHIYYVYTHYYQSYTLMNHHDWPISRPTCDLKFPDNPLIQSFWSTGYPNRLWPSRYQESTKSQPPQGHCLSIGSLGAQLLGLRVDLPKKKLVLLSFSMNSKWFIIDRYTNDIYIWIYRTGWWVNIKFSKLNWSGRCHLLFVSHPFRMGTELLLVSYRVWAKPLKYLTSSDPHPDIYTILTQ